jgi:hypothetical protein
MSTDSPPTTSDPRVRELTTAVVRAWLPWDALAILALVGVFTLPGRWTSTCVVTIVACASIALWSGLRRIEASDLDREVTAPARRLIWTLAIGMYLVAVAAVLIWWSSF